MTLDINQPLQTRDGQPAKYLSISEDGDVLWFAVHNKFQWSISSRGFGGKCYPNGEDTPIDIINTPQKHKLEGWINVFKPKNMATDYYKTKEIADHHAGDIGRIACIDLSKYNIEYEEGEGL